MAGEKYWLKKFPVSVLVSFLSTHRTFVNGISLGIFAITTATLNIVKAKLKTPYSSTKKYLAMIALLKNPNNIEMIVPANTIPVPFAIL